jgi:hypothetical protein
VDAESAKSIVPIITSLVTNSVLAYDAHPLVVRGIAPPAVNIIVLLAFAPPFVMFPLEANAKVPVVVIAPQLTPCLTVPAAFQNSKGWLDRICLEKI